MKLADLIPERMDAAEPYAWTYNTAIHDMTQLVELAEAAGYRLVLAMPQHIEPAADGLPWDDACCECGCETGHSHKCSYASDEERYP